VKSGSSGSWDVIDANDCPFDAIHKTSIVNPLMDLFNAGPRSCRIDLINLFTDWMTCIVDPEIDRVDRLSRSF